jgi:hypothetical protein
MTMRRKSMNGKEHRREMQILNVIVGYQLKGPTIQISSLKEHLENTLNTIEPMDFGFH